MTLLVLDFSFIFTNDNASIVSAAGDTLVLLPGFFMVSNGASSQAGVRMANSGQTLFLDGVAYGFYGVNSNAGNVLNVGETGRAAGSGYGIYIQNGAGQSFVTNAGAISGRDVGLSSGTSGLNLVNSGTIDGSTAVQSAVALTLHNTGTIIGSNWGIYCANGGGTILNDGYIGGTGISILVQGSSAFTIVNTGTLAGGVSLAAGADLFDNRQGAMTGAVYMAAGNDTFLGGSSDEVVNGVNADGDDEYDGGAGLDRYDFSFVSTATRINLTTGIAFGDGIGFDLLTNFERALGGSGADTMIGSGDNDTLSGNGGSDRLLGNGGVDRLEGGTLNDTLDGGAGDDRLLGGLGIDRIFGGSGADVIIGGADVDALTGGAEADTFVYRGTADIESFTAFDPELITDFVHGVDVIDLSGLDANLGVAGNQGFAFVGSAAFTASGQLRFVQAVGNTTIRICTDFAGDPLGNTAIELTGIIALTAVDFVL